MKPNELKNARDFISKHRPSAICIDHKPSLSGYKVEMVVGHGGNHRGVVASEELLVQALEQFAETLGIFKEML